MPEPATDDEIARLATTMNHMHARLESLQVRQRRFVSDAAHELRSPVASIRQHARWRSPILRTPSSKTSRGSSTPKTSAWSSWSSTFCCSRLAEGVHDGEEQVDLDDIVLAEASRIRGTTSFTVATGVGAGRVLGRSAELERVVRSLADNAARHAEGVIALAVNDTGPYAVITVDDDEPGISAADRDRVFDQFVRLDDARARDGGGAGLGLSIVRAVVEAHGGEVSFGESPQGAPGSSCGFRAPRRVLRIRRGVSA